jgi:hypothetical protein
MHPSVASRLFTGFVLLALATPGSAEAGDFLNTYITFHFGDDNLLAGPDRDSPRVGFTNEYFEPFYEGLNEEQAKARTESTLVLYKRMPGFLRGLDTEAALAIEASVFSDPDDNTGRINFRDDGSYLRAVYYYANPEALKGPHLALTAFPGTGKRFRLGYTYDISWGGDEIFGQEGGRFRPAPAVKLDWRHPDLAYAFVGAKSTVGQRDDVRKPDTEWGFLAGGGVEPTSWMSVEAGTGYFLRGTFNDDPYRSTQSRATGVSARLAFHEGLPVGRSVDFRLYRNEPDTVKEAAQPEVYDGGFSFSVAAEWTSLFQTLLDTQDNVLSWNPAYAGDINARLKFGRIRVGADVVYRDVPFLLFNIPSIDPERAVDPSIQMRPQIFGAIFMDVNIPSAHLTPGLNLGLMQPASFSATGSDGTIIETVVVRGANDWDILPRAHVEPFTILSVRASLKWELSQMLSMLGEVSYTIDANQTRVTTEGDNPDTAIRVLDELQRHQLGLNLLLQARF